MSGTTIIHSNQDSCNPCDVHHVKRGYKQLSTVEQKRVQDQDDHSQDSVVNVLNLGDSRKSNCYQDKLDNGTDSSKAQLFDEDDLKNLFNSFKESIYNHYIFDTNLQAIESKKLQEFWVQFYSFPKLFAAERDEANGRYHQEPLVLQPSLFHQNNVPPTIYFKTKLTNECKSPVGLPKSLQPMFKWKISSITPNTIRNCVLFMKFETIRPSNTTDNYYIGSWCKHMPTSDFLHLEEWRKVNHYPGSFHMGRKDKLWTRLKLASQRFQDFETFHPMTFVLPKDYEELDKYWKSSPSNLFIMKPPASARGNGVQVINDISQIPPSALISPQSSEGTKIKKSTMIVQQYISNPCLLENGHKFDLRIYVLITSLDPLRVYVYEEGLVRFASSKYTSQEDGTIDQYMHLTNYFVNKNHREYKINNDCESLHGCKWTLKRFWRYLKEHYIHVDVDELWKKIIDVIVKTVISCENPMTRFSHQNCKNDYTSYELFGFDIILDENFKPWILEVNITPSLKSESLLDTSVKFRVIQDMFNLVGYHLPPPSSDAQSTLDNSFAEHRLFFDPRLYSSNLTKRDKLKHAKYLKLFNLEKTRLHSSSQPESPNETQPEHKTKLIAPRGAPAHDVGQIDEDDKIYDKNLDVCNEEDSSYTSNRLISCDSILSDLTQADVRVLMLSEDELHRSGLFKRVFPSPSSSHYMKYFDKPRYYNLLLDAWENKYRDNRMEGIKRLSKLANFLD